MFLFIEKNAGSTNKTKVWTPRKVVHHEKSDYQEIVVLDTDEHGEVLFLDGVLQSTQSDSDNYHCNLVHPAMYMKSVIHRKNRDTHLWNVLILGGGEGCTMREVLSCYRVQHVTQIDIDKDLVDLFRGPMRHWNCGAYEDRRVEVRIEDAVEWAVKHRGLYETARDAVFIDLTEATDFGRDKWNSIILGACMSVLRTGVIAAYIGTVTEDEYTDIESSQQWIDFCKILKGSFTTSSWKPIHYIKYMPSWNGYALFFTAAGVPQSRWKFQLNDEEMVTYMHELVCDGLNPN